MAVKKTRAGTKVSVKPKRKTSGKAKARPKAKAKPHSKAKLPRAQRKTAVPKKPVRKAKPAAKSAKAAKTAPKISPLAPKSTPKLPPVGGVLLGATAAGIKYKGRTDLLVAKMPEGTQVAGVFTTSKTASAPVEWCRTNVNEGGEGRMLVVNSGNSNAFTGKAGVATVKATAAAAAQAGNCRQKDVFIASTGVIGQPMDPAPVIAGIDAALADASPDAWDEAARAIMTTDTYPKAATRKVKIGGASVTINGIAKGSGMIAPDLATMLVFIFTDAAIPAKVLQTLLLLGVRDSFNAITVDSDTSTSDTVLVFATGAAMADEAPVTRAGDARLRDFRAALDDLMMDLAHQVVKDGEGATKFVKIAVSGAQSHQAARTIAMTIANSPLVKTAIAGEDANWGRIVMAVGKSGEAADRDKLSIRIGGVDVAKNGMAVPGYDETPVARHMKGSDIDIEVDVGVGKSSATVWTCDLTYDYIRINADYRS
ncbi:arginine biosynthesis bifunctional protein ArgJ [Parvibaculum lavamentivorans DS-1]|uniref:Arginine biosynthesis bifunctional protein ArgJ n=1 Tax=Parvibaculum lavamentivorans (strain DS-1 / DSM 13023 / NCIMB 13966) TaxID=402881 RepID=A7HTW8_PARL1|nr:bifunctional glutamate N-acetyltransferase/amino-acid acetyltransferase ArgJ [Parvibaculum lavamentivorans]ABS63351.1 arginine biosynthesis bifunctional protein ArgJ [Parvibaculum lavamentivorans DS-1]